MNAWQKKTVFRRALLRPGRLGLFVISLGGALLANVVLNLFWPAVSLLIVGVMGSLVWLAVDLSRPGWIVVALYGELATGSGLPARLQSPVRKVSRTFNLFWSKTKQLDDATIAPLRKEAFRSMLTLANRLHAVGLTARLTRESRRSGSSDEKGRVLIEQTQGEVEEFLAKLHELARLVTEVRLAGADSAGERLSAATEEMAEWKNALDEAREEMNDLGY